MAKKKETKKKETKKEKPASLTKEHWQKYRKKYHQGRDNNDEIARKLREMTLNQIYKLFGDQEQELRQKYEKLNKGMQRMNLGNRLRARVKNGEKIKGLNA